MSAETHIPPCPTAFGTGVTGLELMQIPAWGEATVMEAGSMSSTSALPGCMWRYGRGQPNKVTVEEAEQRHRERLTEASKRAVQTLKRRREVHWGQGTGCCGYGIYHGTMGTRMLWGKDVMVYTMVYTYVYIIQYTIMYTNDIYSGMSCIYHGI
jgi:hypothetical protein